METRVRNKTKLQRKNNIHEFSKAVMIPVPANNTDQLLDKRIDAVRDFLRGAKKKDSITIHTNDASLLNAYKNVKAAAYQDEALDELEANPMFNNRQEEVLNKIRRKFKQFSIEPITANDHHKVLKNLTDKIQYRIHDDRTPNRESKGYINTAPSNNYV